MEKRVSHAVWVAQQNTAKAKNQEKMLTWNLLHKSGKIVKRVIDKALIPSRI